MARSARKIDDLRGEIGSRAPIDAVLAAEVARHVRNRALARDLAPPAGYPAASRPSTWAGRS